MASQIFLSNRDYVQEEGTAGSTITPGMLIQTSSDGDVDPHAVADGAALPAFAQEQCLNGSVSTDNYSSGDLVRYAVCRSGDKVSALLADGENASIGSLLTSDGAGALAVADAAVQAAATTGVEGNNNGITWTAVPVGAAGNQIVVNLIDPGGNSQSLSVTVTESNTVDVSLATDGGGAITSTPATIIPAVAGVAGAAALVVGTNTGASTGAAAVVAETAILTGGSDADSSGSAIAVANEALDNSSGGAVAAIEVTIL